VVRKSEDRHSTRRDIKSYTGFDVDDTALIGKSSYVVEDIGIFTRHYGDKPATFYSDMRSIRMKIRKRERMIDEQPFKFQKF
jgi:hypothetical protein